MNGAAVFLFSLGEHKTRESKPSYQPQTFGPSTIMNPFFFF